MTSPTLLPPPLLYVGMTPPASFDACIAASDGLYPQLVIAGRFKVIKQSGAEVTWSGTIVPVDEMDRLTVRRAIQEGDIDEAGIWFLFLEYQLGTAPGQWLRSAAVELPVYETFQTRRPA